MRKRIMHIVQSAGGVEVYIQMLLKYMPKDKFEHILVCSYDYSEKNFKDAVKAFEQVEMVREINLKKDYNAIKNVRKLIKKYNPDIVYSHSSKGGAIGRIANIGIKNKSIYNPHGWAFNMDCSNKKKRIYTIIERFLAKFTDRIIAISDSEKQSALEKNICKSNEIEVIFNGIDIEKYELEKNNYKVDRKRLNIPEDAFVIGMVGRISKQKSPDTFIKVAGKINKIINNSFFIIVGDGEQRTEIENLIKKEGIEKNTIITGWVNNSLEYIQLFDLSMLLSRWEGFGLALVEYMISKKPIIATNTDAIPNLIENQKDGCLVNIDDIDQIVDKVLNIYNDNNFKNNIVKNAYVKAKKDFNIKRVSKQHEILIDSFFD